MYPDCPHRLYFVQLCNTTAVPVIHVGLKVDRKRSSSAEGIRNGTLIGQYCNRNALIKLVYTMWLLHEWWRHLAGCASVLRRDYSPSTSFFSNSCIWCANRQSTALERVFRTPYFPQKQCRSAASP